MNKIIQKIIIIIRRKGGTNKEEKGGTNKEEKGGTIKEEKIVHS